MSTFLLCHPSCRFVLHVQQVPHPKAEISSLAGARARGAGKYLNPQAAPRGGYESRSEDHAQGGKPYKKKREGFSANSSISDQSAPARGLPDTVRAGLLALRASFRTETDRAVVTVATGR